MKKLESPTYQDPIRQFPGTFTSLHAPYLLHLSHLDSHGLGGRLVEIMTLKFGESPR